MLAILVHLTSAGDGLRDPLTLVRGLSGIGTGTMDVLPENPALGLMLLALMAILFVVLVATAGIGSAVRSVLPRPRQRLPARSARRAAAWSAPLVVAAFLVGYLGWTNWSVPDDTRITDTVEAGHIEPIIARARPGTLSPSAACTAIFGALSGSVTIASSLAADGMDRSLATVASLALSSTDPTLRMMGEATVESLRGKQLKLAASNVGVTARYCLARPA
jgi:hypothetical protein